MGATFTEGAIQQHISKLRTKMATMNVAPVPGPPLKRGQMATKPSTVYSSKVRAGPAPVQPMLPVKARARRATTTASQRNGVTKGRGGRAGRTIKRSASDDSDSEDEYMPKHEYVDNTSGTPNHANRQFSSRNLSNNQAPPSDEATRVIDELTRADAVFLQDNPGYAADYNQQLAQHYPSSEIQGQNFPSFSFEPRGHQTNFSLNPNSGEEEEEEDEDQFSAARRRSMSNGQFRGLNQPSQPPEGISPTSPVPNAGAF